jgi:hypothetical protein
MTTNTTTNTNTIDVGATGRRARQIRRAAAAAATLALVGAGCSGEDLTERFVENAIERESGENVDIDLDGGNIRIETDEGVVEMNADGEGNISITGEGTDGNISIDSDDGVTVIESDEGTAVIEAGGAGVPDSFPGSVPLPDGFSPEFSQSISTSEGEAWTLAGEMSSSVADIVASYFPQLEGAGFERLQVTETPDSVIFTFGNGEYSVTGLAGDDGSDGTFFNVTVAPSES